MAAPFCNQRVRHSMWLKTVQPHPLSPSIFPLSTSVPPPYTPSLRSGETLQAGPANVADWLFPMPRFFLRYENVPPQQRRQIAIFHPPLSNVCPQIATCQPVRCPLACKFESSVRHGNLLFFFPGRPRRTN